MIYLQKYTKLSSRNAKCCSSLSVVAVRDIASEIHKLFVNNLAGKMLNMKDYIELHSLALQHDNIFM